MSTPSEISSNLAPLEQLPTDQHRYLKPWVVLISVWLFVAAVLGFFLILQRQHMGDAERDRMATQARVIEENLTRQLKGAASALAGVRYDLSSGDRDPDLKIAPLRLKVLSDAMPGVRAMVVLNHLGTVMDSDRAEMVGRNFSESQTFRVPAAEADPATLYISPPFKSPIGGFTISLGKAMRDTDGKFSGVVIATLDPDYFDTLMGSVFYAPDMAGGIVHGDGRVVAVLPANPQLLGTNVDVEGSVFRRHKDAGAVVNLFEGKGATAKPLEDRIVAVRTMQPADLLMNKALVISVSRLSAEVYAPWRAEVRSTLAMATAVCIASVLLVYYAQRRRKVLASIRANVRALVDESSKRFEFGLKGADLGLWDWELDTDKLTISDREAAMLGFDLKQKVHSAKVWQRLIYPEDWPAVREKFRQLLDGEAEAYKLEHRMLHRQGHPVWVLSQAMVMERTPEGRVIRILGTHLDISTRKLAEDELRTALKRLELAMKCGSIGLMDWDVRNGGMVLNALGRQLLGIAGAQPMTATDWRALRHPEDTDRAEAELQRLLTGVKQEYSLELRLRHGQGHYLWLYARGEVVERDADGMASRVIVTYRDVSERVAAEQMLRTANAQLAELSVTDALTGIGNRRRFDQALASEWARGMRVLQPVALLMIDIDYFKLYNDHYGHQAGDDCLRQVAAVLSRCARRPDELLARYGGEEFAVLMYGSDTEAALKLALRCVDEIRAAALPHEGSKVARHITLSIGVHSVVPTPGDASANLVKMADEALYQAKGNGRNRAYVLSGGV
ncbi:MAG: hypothetical protein JWP29_1726 [Rhodoferax sp.]|nr:hypothetical protein [Rhodoferax sp.]